MISDEDDPTTLDTDEITMSTEANPATDRQLTAAVVSDLTRLRLEEPKAAFNDPMTSP